MSYADHVDSIYCSAATKELLLRLERYPHRLNFELGILESRRQQYKHLSKLLVSKFSSVPDTYHIANQFL